MPDFTITFICHSDLPLTKLTIAHTIKSLCSYTQLTYDLILIVDNCPLSERSSFIDIYDKLGFSEIRFRSRNHNVSSGDPSNNGHYYAFTTNTPYQITIESDVVVIRKSGDTTDVLQQIKDFFVQYPTVSVAYKIDDFHCWAEKLEFYEDFSAGIKNASRVSSHFLIYNTNNAQSRFVASAKRTDLFHDSETAWYNYEDYIGKTFRKSTCEPGIAFLEYLPISVYHCDEKIADGSPFYSKNLSRKIEIFHERLFNERI